MYAELNKNKVNIIDLVTPKLEVERKKMEFWARSQRKAAFIGFIAIVILKSVQELYRVII
jgi:hypothetical protein